MASCTDFYTDTSRFNDHWLLQLVVYILFALETVQTALATHDFVHQVEPFTSNDQYVQFLWLSVIVFTGMSKSLSNNHSNRI